MNKIDWKLKLSSRKFWAAVAGVATAVLVLCNVNELTIEKVAALISAEGVLIAYIFAEGDVDSNRVSQQDSQQNKGETK